MPATKTIKKPAAKRSKVKATLPSLAKLNALKQELSTVKSIEDEYNDDLFEVECEIVEERNEEPTQNSTEVKSESEKIVDIPVPETNPKPVKVPKINIEADFLSLGEKGRSVREKELSALVKKVIEEEMSKKAQLKEEKRKQKIEEQLKAKAKEREELQSYLKNQIGSIQNRYKQELTKNLQFSY